MKGKIRVYGPTGRKAVGRITANGQSTEIYTQCQVEPKKWNQRLERIPFRDKVSMRINQIVASYRANILAAYDQLI